MNNECAEVEQQIAELENVEEQRLPRRSQRQKSAPKRLGSITGDWWDSKHLYGAEKR
eukprot:gene17178-18907_t